MIRVNCTVVDTALDSVAGSLRLMPAELRHRIEHFDFTTYMAERHEAYADYEEVLWDRVALRAMDDRPTPDEVIWFHATRVPRDTPFDRVGLLPLKDCLEALEKTVKEIAESLAICGERGHASVSYLNKLSRLAVQGPCASLLRDAALGKGRARNFLKSPEIVEDLAHDLAGARANDVLAAYRSRTTPCIVSFRSAKPRPDVVSRALAYCHSAMHGSDDPLHWNTCFENQGNPIASSDIVDVEWLDG